MAAYENGDPCPSCGTDLAYEESGRWYSRRIGHIWNDRVQEWTCPDCGHTWPRGA